MKKIAFLLLSMCFVFMLLRVSAQSGSENPPVAQQSKAGAHAKSAAPAEGERLFQQNCSRCHNAPQSISPRISGTVIRHMRVRASLNEKDERELMRFMNP
jgi:cytochrome c5